MMSVSALMATMAMAVTPTNGDLRRELATDPAAYNLADTDGDGRISDLEFDRYKRYRRGEASSRIPAQNLGGYDANGDSALTPFELYAEADGELDGPRYRSDLPPGVTREEAEAMRRARIEREYYVDDRDGTVYGPDY